MLGAHLNDPIECAHISDWQHSLWLIDSASQLVLLRLIAPLRGHMHAWDLGLATSALHHETGWHLGGAGKGSKFKVWQMKIVYLRSKAQKSKLPYLNR